MTHHNNRLVIPLGALAFLGFVASCSTTETGPKVVAAPATQRGDVVDDYHGNKVADPYRWLEDIDSSETRAWFQAQNKITEAYLSKVPQRGKISKRIKELWSYERYGAPFKEGESWYYFHNNGLQNQSILYKAEGPGPDQKGTVFLDPNKLSEDGTVALGGLSFSKDGRYLAYAISRSGSDWREWRVMETATGKQLADKITWTKFTSATWNKDATGFYYQRYPKPEAGKTYEQANQAPRLCYHQIGTDETKDRVVYLRPDHPKWGFGTTLGDEGRYLILSIWSGTDPKRRVLYMDLSQSEPEVQPLLMQFDASYGFLGNNGGKFFFLTDKDAPRRRIVAIDIADPAPEKWQELVPEAKNTLAGAAILGGKLVLTYLEDAHSVAEVRDLDGKNARPVLLPGIGSVGGFSGKRKQKEVFFTFNSFTTPTTVYHLNLDNTTVETLRTPKVQFDPTQYTTRQVFLQSKDGTRVPMFLVHKNGLALDGNNPTYLYGYGGFNISLTPRFSVETIAWLEMGGIYAQPTLRGGGEYGASWHESGMLLNKQNVFDDFLAAAHYLIRNDFTQPSKLAIGGRSNGGLLVGAALTQAPTMFGAAIPEVGVLDMLRYHKFTIGHAWVPEYGSSANPEMFEYLLAYSPLHNIKHHTEYPATLIMTGDHDDRVLPGHSFKFAAELQAQQKGPAPILIRVEENTGHGAGKPVQKRIAEAADRWAFLAQVLGMKF